VSGDYSPIFALETLYEISNISIIISAGRSRGGSFEYRFCAAICTAQVPKCPTAKFLDLSKSKGAGVDYTKPSSKVTCTTSEVVVTTNNMISFPFINKTPHTLAPQNLVVKFPRDPKVTATPTKIVNQLDTMGVTV
jgi:hypothetical protein